MSLRRLSRLLRRQSYTRPDLTGHYGLAAGPQYPSLPRSSLPRSSLHTSAAAGSEARPKTTHFGFTDVTEEEKEQKVRGVFESVAGQYDAMNDAMSLGVHRLWKDRFVDVLGPVRGARMLDVAGGTGDIAFRCIERLLRDAPAGAPHPSSQVTVCDLSAGMLREGQRRAAALGYDEITWLEGNALALPFPDHAFDSYSIAFGIRNVVDIPKALSEAYRVLKPGGRFLCLEFSRVRSDVLRWAYDQYSFGVIPPLGHVVAGDWASYRYLVESIRRFPPQEEFSAMIADAGFVGVTEEDLTFGVTAIHTGLKL